MNQELVARVMLGHFGLPQVYREREISFVIYSNEGNEPPHVHAIRGYGRGGASAKFWTHPTVVFCSNEGFNPAELRWIKKTITERQDFFVRQYHATQTYQK